MDDNIQDVLRRLNVQLRPDATCILAARRTAAASHAQSERDRVAYNSADANATLQAFLKKERSA